MYNFKARLKSVVIDDARHMLSVMSDHHIEVILQSLGNELKRLIC
jgi:hypothetical protein